MKNTFTFARSSARSLVVNLQKKTGLFPHEFCLITGSPRSGTSALVRWLGTHKQISAFPESRILIGAHRFLEEAHRFRNLDKEIAKIELLAQKLVYDYYIDSRLSLGKKLIMDKEPLEPIAFPSRDYVKFVANVRKILPKAKLLLAIRDPFSTIWSMSRRTWGESLSAEQEHRFTLYEHIETWKAGAEIVLQYHELPDVHVVQFGRLVNHSENESKKIFDFLKLRDGVPFKPRETNEVNFNVEERELILSAVSPVLEKLMSAGINDLS